MKIHLFVTLLVVLAILVVSIGETDARADANETSNSNTYTPAVDRAGIFQATEGKTYTPAKAAAALRKLASTTPAGLHAGDRAIFNKHGARPCKQNAH